MFIFYTPPPPAFTPADSHKRRSPVVPQIYETLTNTLRTNTLQRVSPVFPYRLDCDGKLAKLLDGIGCSNGMGFTLDRKQMYYTDSTRHEIYIFDYDRKSGALTNQRVFVRTPEDEGVPDGMTVDAEGHIWTAKWGGWCMVRYTPDGKEERRVKFPASAVSSVIFGGGGYTDIYVTTANGNKKETEGAGAGALFRVRLGIKGLPEFPSRILLK